MRRFALVVPLLFMVFMFGPGVFEHAGLGSVQSAKPTWFLIQQAGALGGLDTRAWAEVGRRTLTVEQEHALLEILLDTRRRWGHLESGAQTWVDALLARGAMPADLRDRYFGEMLEGVLAGPERAAAGEPIALELRCTFRDPLGLNVDLVLCVEGLRLDDAVESRGRGSAPTSRWSLEEGEDYRDARLPLPPLTIDRPGPHVVRFALWQVFGPRASIPKSIEWNEDGTPVLDPAVIDARRVEYEHRIDIVP